LSSQRPISCHAQTNPRNDKARWTRKWTTTFSPSIQIRKANPWLIDSGESQKSQDTSRQGENFPCSPRLFPYQLHTIRGDVSTLIWGLTFSIRRRHPQRTMTARGITNSAMYSYLRNLQLDTSQCPTCGRSILTHQLGKHQLLLDPRRKFACATCHYRFSTITYLNKHRDQVHVNSDQRFDCPLCGKVIKDIQRHFGRCHNVRLLPKFPCTKCICIFYTNAELDIIGVAHGTDRPQRQSAPVPVQMPALQSGVLPVARPSRTPRGPS
jgi:transposase-like protein